MSSQTSGPFARAAGASCAKAKSLAVIAVLAAAPVARCKKVLRGSFIEALPDANWLASLHEVRKDREHKKMAQQSHCSCVAKDNSPTYPTLEARSLQHCFGPVRLPPLRVLLVRGRSVNY